ncbi:hypothetical protein DSM104299_01889 [Baekduia alba]|uniref:hypothetical protein n=1 Tax=Baekduia alba TaxID=2997333 RepID=UPI00233FE05E|nr:hypothetical protein [Baekduia alba]WCB93183.1 hypothetical protein DSM104299_01889 [Baekduia alba]
MILLTRFFAALRALLPKSDDSPDQTFATPKVTLPQKLALGQAVVAVLIVLGFDLDPDTQQLIIGLSALLAAALPASDAAIRRGRAEHSDKIAAATEKLATVPTTASPLALGDEDRTAILDGLLRR